MGPFSVASKKRCYKQYCGVARALDVLGERWTLLIVRDLLLGPWRYTDLKARLPGITTNLLAERLKEMEISGLLTKSPQASVGSPHVYELTQLGRQLEPVVLSLASFGAHFMASGPQKGEQIDIGRALLSLKLRPHIPGSGLITLRFDSIANNALTTHYQIKYTTDYVHVRHGGAWESEVEIKISRSHMAALLFRQGDVGLMEKIGEIVVKGNRQHWLAFLDNFGFKYSKLD